jgi:hypothetical protein
VNQWNNEEMRRRQSQDDVGFLTGSRTRPMWRGLLVPAVVLVVGFVLVYVGPVPGLGVFLVIGGLMAAGVVDAPSSTSTERRPISK